MPRGLGACADAGDPEAVKAIHWHADDVVLANPLRPCLGGLGMVRTALDFASSRFQDGDVDPFEVLARFDDGEMVVVHALEDWRARVPDRPEVEPFRLRVTTVLRREGGGLRSTLKHADPIATADASGPMRGR